MGLATTEQEWAAAAEHFLKAELKRDGRDL